MKIARKTIMALFLFLFFWICTAAAGSQTYDSPEQFAEQNFKRIVLEHIRSDAAGYHLSANETISFSPLHKVHLLSKKFNAGDGFNREKIMPNNEWVSIVYQDGQPVNVIGVYQNEQSEYALSVFGYGKELAEALDAIKSEEPVLIFDAPMDSWYALQGETVTGLSGLTVGAAEKGVSLEKFHEMIQKQYKEEKGGSVRAEGAVLTEPADGEKNSLFYWLGAAVLLLMLGAFYLKSKFKRGER